MKFPNERVEFKPGHLIRVLLFLLYLFIYLFIYFFIYLFIYQFIYLFLRMLVRDQYLNTMSFACYEKDL